MLTENVFFRKIVIWGFALLLTVSCSGVEESDGVLKIRFMAGGQIKKKAYDELAAEFAIKNLCRIELIEDFNGNLKTDGADIIEIEARDLAFLAEKNELSTLDYSSYINYRFLSYALKNGFVNRKLFALPVLICPMALYYNVGILKGSVPPNSMEEFIALSGSLYDAPKRWGFASDILDKNNYFDTFEYFMRLYGGKYIDSAGSIDVNSSENRKALQVYLRLINSSRIGTRLDAESCFIAGKSAFIIAGPQLSGEIKERNPNLIYGTTFLPGRNGTTGKSPVRILMMALNKKSKNQELALSFLKFLSEKETSVKLLQYSAAIGLPAANWTEIGKNLPDDLKIIKKCAENPALQPHIECWRLVKYTLHNELTAVFSGWSPSGVLGRAQNNIVNANRQ